jgi:hypothetical protein
VNNKLKRIWKKLVAYSKILASQVPEKTKETQQNISMTTAGALTQI